MVKYTIDHLKELESEAIFIIREIAETKPYGQAALVYTANYYYSRGNV